MKRQTDECRAWLESYRELRTEANRLWQRHLRLAAQATRTTTQLSLVPGGGGSDREQLLASMADADAEAVAKHMEAADRMREIEGFIDSLPSQNSRIILRYKYVEMLHWPELKRALEKSGIYYDERHIYRLHGLALNEAREAWNRRGEQHG